MQTTSHTQFEVPTFADVEHAARTLAGVATRTPVLHSRTLNSRLGAEVFFKAEPLQRTGAFKFRGAYNSIANLDEDARKAGVLTYSSGNHAQAIALAGNLLGVKTTIVMPEDAPAAKKAATQGYGAHIVTYDRYSADREAIAKEISRETGAVIIPPYDYPHVIAGQGTAAKELFEDVGALDVLLVCLGGGGLLSGCALSASALSPGCEVYGVEPELGNDGQRSFRTGEIVTITPPKSIADGALTPSVGRLPFAIIQEKVTDILTVTDDQLVQTMRWFAQRMKLVVEPTGCLAAAAVMQGVYPVQPGSRIGVILSGGNVDLSAYGHLLAG